MNVVPRHIMTAPLDLVRRSCVLLQGLYRSQSGTITVESVIILPILFFGLMATYAYHDSYRHKSWAVKGNYAVSDYLSRVKMVDQNGINGLNKLFGYMSQSSKGSWLRVTLIQCDDDCDNDDKELELEWSHVSSPNGPQPHTEESLEDFVRQYVPVMYEDQFALVVETSASYKPVFPVTWTGIFPTKFNDLVVTTSREYDFLCWKDDYDDDDDECDD